MTDSYNRFNKYVEILKELYGASNLKNIFQIDDKNLTLRIFKDKTHLNKFLINYNRTDLNADQGCKGANVLISENQLKLCSDDNIFRNYFLSRPMEIPGFEGFLDFNKNIVKKIFVIGEAAGPGILTHLNITYGLGNFPIDKVGNMDLSIISKVISNLNKQNLKRFLQQIEERLGIKNMSETRASELMESHLSHKLWQYLRICLANDFNDLKSEFYISDICKCNDDTKEKPNKNERLWIPCQSKYLLKEIELINPKLIIFLGGSPFESLKKAKREIEIDFTIANFRNKFLHTLKKTKDQLTTEENKIYEKFIPKTIPKYGRITLKEIGKIYPYVMVLHNSPQNSNRWKHTSKFWQKFFENHALVSICNKQ